MSRIMLAQKFNPKKLQFPCYLTEKLDGVAADMFVPPGGYAVVCRSRQDKPLLGAELIRHTIDVAGILRPGDHLIGELYNPDMSFSEISGKARANAPAPDLEFWVYDYYTEGRRQDFHTRLHNLFKLKQVHDTNRVWNKVKIIPLKYVVRSEDILRTCINNFREECPDSEGLVMRYATGPDAEYTRTRSWGMQKIKFRETVDLRVLAVEEAISQTGDPKGMVGKIVCEYQGQSIGVSPGRMTRFHRVRAWEDKTRLVGKIVEVQYMPDSEYTALREPQFIRIRDDKEEPNEESSS